MRLDLYLQQYYSDISRAQLQHLIKNGQVTVNGETQKKNGYSLGEDDFVEVDTTKGIEQTKQELNLEVLYEDQDCVVINKPVGVLTHSKGAFNPEPSVATWLAECRDFSFESEEGNMRRGIVHRLDRATSGVMIAAKNSTALKHLQKQFQDRKAKKTYIARVEGELDPPEALIDLPIERNPKQPQRFRVGQNGKSAQTTYKVLQVIEKGKVKDSLIELKPSTGRTHQLRVHLNYLKRPIVGDKFYAGRDADRLFLHASGIEFTLPNKQRKTFTTEIPKEFYKTDI